METALARIRALPRLVLIGYVLMVALFVLGLWTGDRPVMAVAVAGVLAITLAWWVST